MGLQLKSHNLLQQLESGERGKIYKGMKTARRCRAPVGVRIYMHQRFTADGGAWASEAVHTQQQHMWLGAELWHHGRWRGKMGIQSWGVTKSRCMHGEHVAAQNYVCKIIFAFRKSWLIKKKTWAPMQVIPIQSLACAKNLLLRMSLIDIQKKRKHQEVFKDDHRKTPLTPKWRHLSENTLGSIQRPGGRTTQTAVVFSTSYHPPLISPLPSGHDASRVCNHEGPLPFSLFNEMTKQQIYICRNRCCNRFDSSWPKTCCVGENGKKTRREKSYWEQLPGGCFRLWWAFASTPSALLVARSDNLN